MDADSDLALGSIGHVLALSGNKAGAESILRELRRWLNADISRPTVSPSSILDLTTRKRHLTWMEKLYRECNDWLVWLRVGPNSILYFDPRFDSLLRRVGLNN
jgi:hypothetical protein